VLNVVTLAFVLYHAVTWFQLTPKAMVVRLRGRRVPGAAIAASAYAGWVVVSGLVAWLVLRG
jgi:fumarate reductase subunit C